MISAAFQYAGLGVLLGMLLVTAVVVLVERLLPTMRCDLANVAENLGFHRRTLQRRLADRGMSWQQLLDRTREQLARQYLRDPGLSLAEIGLLLRHGPAMAAGGDPLDIVNNLSDFIFSIIKALGVIILGWGIVQVGMSIQSHDASQRTQGFLCLFGGLMIAFAKEILTAIGAI